MEYLSKNVKETAEIANDFASHLKPNKKMATVVGLYGDLGSGKTTFMKYLAESFGVEETVQSPTFVIMRIYKTSPPNRFSENRDSQSAPLSLARRGGLGGEVFKHLIHIDAYRIEKPEEMLNLGWNDIIMDPNNLICVEWPERISGIMPEHIMVKFEHVSKTQRKINIA